MWRQLLSSTMMLEFYFEFFKKMLQKVCSVLPYRCFLLPLWEKDLSSVKILLM